MIVPTTAAKDMFARLVRSLVDVVVAELSFENENKYEGEAIGLRRHSISGDSVAN